MEYKKKRGLGGFWITVLVLVGLIIVMTALLILTGSMYRIVPAEQEAVVTVTPTPVPMPSPSAALQPDSGNGQSTMPETTQQPLADATVTPEPGTQEMPELDGVAPDLSEYEGSVFYNNPIPAIYEAVSDSVVGVLNYQTQQVGELSLLAEYGSGSGFIVSSDGYILTNAHVIEGAERLTVIFTGGDELDASVVGYDYETDVAVLKIDKEGLVPVAIGDSDACRVGDFVIAIGNPLSTTQLADTTTFGVISATSRTITIDSYTNEYLQTDAAINFGNSGGPLLNMKGEVIGMNSAKSVTAGYDSYGNAVSAEGIGFALPINKVISVMQQLIEKGELQRPAVGISVVTLSDTVAAAYGVDITTGVYVASVVKDGPADLAGLKAGDVIIAANGETLVDKERLVEIIGECTIGDTINVQVYRNGETLDLTIILANKNQMDFDDIAD